jgi:hypothetical protein
LEAPRGGAPPSWRRLAGEGRPFPRAPIPSALSLCNAKRAAQRRQAGRPSLRTETIATRSPVSSQCGVVSALVPTVYLSYYPPHPLFFNILFT